MDDDIIRKQMRAVAKAMKEKHGKDYVVTYNLQGDDMSRPRTLLTKGYNSGDVEQEFNSVLGWERKKVTRMAIHRQKYESKWW